MTSIHIPKGSIKLAGLLFQPSETIREVPAIVVVNPGGGVKEQTAGIYARRLADRGYVTVCYDASNQGASEGQPHFLEDPSARVTDVSAVVDYLQKQSMVDANKISVVGICAGGGYAVAAAKGDHRVRAVAVVSAVNIGDGARLGWLGKEDASKQTAGLAQVALALQAEAQGGEAATAPYVPEVLDDRTPFELSEAHKYYLTPRARHPNAQNKMLVRSVPLVLTFDAWAFADLYLMQPLLIIVGEKAESRWHSEILYEKVKAKNKDLKKIVVPNGRHMDFYDNDEYVNPAVDEMDEYLRQFGH
ncbi:hypothetical protein CAC42_3907 [Sphaceloma murrayae]|uniref:Xaa-Pro dipeptidyl-peptidase-like domain-containing protein n=1 Tax=Sphaceloma murrayae TaxID=2082308 RepID=A0A2K1QS80_9PEZI|nr:hypothetical protein CAC42_3907 [Sphaceloma murrayae]